MAADASVITITFGDAAENHVGMQKLGRLAESGFSVEELVAIDKELTSKGNICELVELNAALCGLPEQMVADRACVLIVRNGVDMLLGEGHAERTREELYSLEWDAKALMYGRVVNKHARHNLCFAQVAQAPSYEEGKGRVISFESVPRLDALRLRLPSIFGAKAQDLFAEGNLYYGPKCGIGFHGDSERKIVVAARFGASMPLDYQWFFEGAPIGNRVELVLNHGDLYVMSEKATGNDWKRKKIPTLRHAAGAKEFRTIPSKKRTAKQGLKEGPARKKSKQSLA
eukprot:a842174_22.p2 GENE.a842174_22~~a842174_22.p2  ORF type:complete len:299 (-),score=18.09 a842174_22:335-1189(-)